MRFALGTLDAYCQPSPVANLREHTCARAARKCMALLALLALLAVGDADTNAEANAEGGARTGEDIRRLELTLEASAGRRVPVQVTLPGGDCSACTVIAFSHGAYAAPERYNRLTRLWAEGGYVVVAPLHVDSELNPTRDDYDSDAAMLARLEDFALLVSDALRGHLREQGITVQEQYIAAGHSYGALIVQAAAGARLQTVAEMPQAFLDVRSRLLGVVAISPPGPVPDYIEAQDWEEVALPQLVVTGTTDVLPGFVDDWRLHLASYEVARLAPAYSLVYEGQDHNMNGAYCRPTETLSADAETALASLGTLSLRFMASLRAGQLPAVMEWRSLSDTVVQADAKIAAKDRSD